jgi:uncharacterized membrane protein
MKESKDTVVLFLNVIGFMIGVIVLLSTILFAGAISARAVEYGLCKVGAVPHWNEGKKCKPLTIQEDL